jgi:hypothetical protein
VAGRGARAAAAFAAGLATAARNVRPRTVAIVGASALGRDEPEADRLARERLLGTQRLPRAAEIREPELDTARYQLVPGVPLGVPAEVTPPGDAPPDTLPLPSDTLPPDTVPPPGTVRPPDALPRPDTLPPDAQEGVPTA